ncbi:MAG: hypothetical protein P8M80_16080 [Pirellulaceae bacterium]|nr:hypothetical protein [Pirellulaceae bacterium]
MPSGILVTALVLWFGYPQSEFPARWLQNRALLEFQTNSESLDAFIENPAGTQCQRLHHDKRIALKSGEYVVSVSAIPGGKKVLVESVLLYRGEHRILNVDFQLVKSREQSKIVSSKLLAPPHPVSDGHQ